MTFTNKKQLLATTAAVAVVTVALAGCSAGGGDAASSDDTILIGTTDRVTSIDPVGSYDQGSFDVKNQIYSFLMSSPYGTGEVQPDIATSAEFTSPSEYTVKLKPGLTFANGHELTSSDVKFSFDRQLHINYVNGPVSLLYNLDSVSAPDDATVVFTLKSENDQTWPQVLSSIVSAIVDEEVFSPDEVTPDVDIVEANAFSEQYAITSYDFNNLISYTANSAYQGIMPEARTETINVKYYAEASNLKLDIQEGNVDVAWRSLSATDIADLAANDNLKVVDGPGGEIRYIVFNFDTMPYGAKTAEADPAKALAVRQAAADLIDRAEIGKQVYRDTYTPLFSYVPAGLLGASEPLQELYGDGSGGPDAEKAAARLKDAGVAVPVKLSLQYNSDHYGPSSGDEYAIIKDQLEATGLFAVDLQATEWVQYTKDRSADVYPAYQLGGFPDYSDADNYLSAFFLEGNFLQNHYDDATVNGMIRQQVVTVDKTERMELLQNIQSEVAKDLPTLPYLQGAQVAVTGANITGTSDTLDAAFKFRYAALAKE